VFDAPDRGRLHGLQNGATVCALSGGRLVALAKVDGVGLRPIRVMTFE